MKKALVLLLTVVLLAGVFSGCGDKEWTGKHEVEMVIDHYGTIVLEINCDAAPQTASNFLNLVRKGFYNKLTIYRVINGFAICMTTILGYTAMASAAGGGGLGALAITRGLNLRQYDVMYAASIVLVILVQIITMLGSYLTRKFDHRIR